MRSMIDMDTVQIEITNYCTQSCSNCSRFCPHVKQPFYMEMEQFKQAVDSMVGYPKMTGIQGGEPLLHPQFPEICEYLRSKIPYEQLGLWTTLPKGFEKYREILCKTFKHIFINDHTRDDIYHHPALVAIREVVTDECQMWNKIDHCWAQMSWSASINPRGTWFCEIAASMAMLFGVDGLGWPIEKNWWCKIPKDFTKQMEAFCPICGFAAPIHRRKSIEPIDDISPNNLELFKDHFRNIERFKVHSLQTTDRQEMLAAYKDTDYRNRIAARYNMFVMVNDQNFWTPYLKTTESVVPEKRRRVQDVYMERIKCEVDI